MFDADTVDTPTAPTRAITWTAEARALIHLAGPLVATQLAQMAILTTDIVLLGRLSTEALAAAAIGNAVYYFAWLIGCGPASAVAPMIAHLTGAKPKDRAGVRAIVRMGLWASVITAAPLMLVILTAGDILAHLGQEPALAAEAGKYVAMLGFGLPFAVGFRVLGSFATALGRPAASLWVVLGAIVFNGIAGWALIFGHLGLPALGLIGGGIATSASAVFSFTAMAIVIRLTPALAAYRPWRRFVRPAGRKLAELFRLGMPIGLTMLFEAMLFNTMTLVVGTFGAAPLAAHQIALNFASVTFMVPLGVAMAATVRVGRFAGAGDMPSARQAGLVAMAVAVAAVALSGLAMAFFGREIASLYVAERNAEDMEVIALAASFLLVAAAFQAFDALQVVGALSLRGLKDARAPMIIAGASYWLAGAPMCVWLAMGLGLQGLGVWIGLAFGLGVAAAAMCGRFHLLTRKVAAGAAFS